MEVVIDAALEYYGKKLNNKPIDKMMLEENKSGQSTMIDSLSNVSNIEV